MPNWYKPIGKTDETLLRLYEKSQARLQKIRDASYTVFSIWRCEFKKQLFDNPGLQNELCSHPYVKHSKISIWHALYGGRTEDTKTYYTVKQGEANRYVDVISLYTYIF